MDISIFGNLCLGAVFAPLFFGLYLFVSRLNKSFINKKLLNNGAIIVNLISLMIFSVSYFFVPNGEILNFDFSFFLIEKFCLNLGFLINETNLLFLIYASFLCFLVSLYSNLYFTKKKQFIFTKQRYYAFLSVLSSLVYVFLASINLFQGMMVLILQSVLVLIFSYCDIFKNPTNYNITRFHQISHLGNFSLFVAISLLFKYAILSQGYISSISLNYDELNVLISYMYGLSSSFEFKLMAIALIIAVFSRLAIFPLSCYYSFFANSSNILYLSVISCLNNIIGLFLFLKILPLIKMANSYILAFEIFLALAIAISIIQILFERNIKIIFGYLFAAINSGFIILFLNFNSDFICLIYFGINLLFLIILMFLFYINKTNFKKRLVNKQLGFILEKTHILFFEKIPSKISDIFEIIDERIIQNLSYFIVKILDFFASIFVQKITKTNSIKIIKNILIIFAIIAILAILIALFGGFKC